MDGIRLCGLSCVLFCSVAGIAGAASAAEYTLGGKNGAPDCGRVRISAVGPLTHGVIYQPDCNPNVSPLAATGVSTKLRGNTTRVWTLTVSFFTGTYLYVIDTKNLTWQLYGSDILNPLSLTASGPLLKD